MVKYTRITASFGEDKVPNGYNSTETYEFNLIVLGNKVTLFPCDTTPVISFDSIHEFLLAFKLVEIPQMF